MEENKNWFVHSPEGCGFETFETEIEAADIMDEERLEWEGEARHYGEWGSECESAVMGKITHKHQLIDKDGHSELELCKVDEAPTFNDGVTFFAAWLVDNAEGEVITEEMLLRWAVRAITDVPSMKIESNGE